MKNLFTKQIWASALLLSASFCTLQVKAQNQTPERSLICTQGTDIEDIESGNIKTKLLNAGDMFWDLTNQKFEVPKGSGKHSMFSGAIWFGGIEQSSGYLHLAAQTYRQGNPPDAGFWPGPLDVNGQISDYNCAVFDYIAKVHANVVYPFRDYAQTASLPIDSATIPSEVIQWLGKGNPFKPAIANSPAAGQLAPFVDRNGDGIYDPRDGDYPDFPGDQAAFAILNDAGGYKQPVSPTIGVEVHVLMYGYDAPNNPAVANTIFARYTFINRGNKALTNTYFGNYVDFDLGNYNDDFVGSDSTRNLYYAYNGDNDDEGIKGYGINPPAQGVVFLNHPLTNFTTFGLDGNVSQGFPQYDTDFFNYMRSFWRNGTNIYYGGDGTSTTAIPPATRTKYMFSGDPENGAGWTEATAAILPGDRIGLGTYGPFTFTPGNIRVFDVAYPFAQGSNHLNSVTALKQAADAVQAFYNNTIAGVDKTEQVGQEIRVYPNPASKAVEVVLPAATTGKATYTLCDITGRTVLQTVSTVTIQPQIIDMQQLPKGMYLLQVQTSGNTYTTKIIKQ